MNLHTLPHRWQAILSIDEQKSIIAILESTDVDWFIANATVNSKFIPEYNYDERVLDTYNCVHKIFYQDNDSISPIVETKYFLLLELSKKIAHKISKELNIQIKEFLRIKANSLFTNPGFTANNFNVPHKDYTSPDNVMSIVYYVNSGDGDTVVFNEYDKDNMLLGEPVRYKPIQGSAIAFKSNMYHASSNPVNHLRRTVINISFTYEENNDTLARS